MKVIIAFLREKKESFFSLKNDFLQKRSKKKEGNRFTRQRFDRRETDNSLLYPHFAHHFLSGGEKSFKYPEQLNRSKDPPGTDKKIDPRGDNF